MNRIGYGIGLGLVCFGCSGEGTGEALGTTSQALGQTNVPAVGSTIGYQRSDNLNAVLYGNGAQMRELLKAGPAWTVSTLASNLALNATPTAVAALDGWNHVFYWGPNSTVFDVRISSAGVPQAPVPVPSGNAAYNQSAYVGALSVMHVAYRGQDNHIYDLSYNAGSGTWASVDVSTNSGAAVVPANTDVVGHYGPIGGSIFNRIVFRGAANHVYMHVQLPGDPWSPAMNVSQSCSAPVALGRPYAFRNGVTQIVYAGNDNRLRLIEPDFSNCVDLTTVCAGRAPSSEPVGYVRSGGFTAVVYRSGTQVRQIRFTGSGCVDESLTAAAGAPPAITSPASLARPNAYLRNDGFNAVLFRSSDEHVWELLQDPQSGSWAKKDLTAEAGGTL